MNYNPTNPNSNNTNSFTPILSNSSKTPPSGFSKIWYLVFGFLIMTGLVSGFLLVRQIQTTNKKASEIVLNCPVDAFQCRFEKEAGVSYVCVINEVTNSGKVEVNRPEVKTDPISGKGLCTYSPQAGKKYDCTVTAVKEPGCSTTASAESSCMSIPLSPSPSTIPSPSPTLSPTITPTMVPGCFDKKCNGLNDKDSCANLIDHVCADTKFGAGSDFRCVTNSKCVSPSDTNPKSCWCTAPTLTPSPTPTLTKTPTPTQAPTNTPTPTQVPSCYDTKCKGSSDFDTCSALQNHTCIDTDPSSKLDYRCVLSSDCKNAPPGNPKSCWCEVSTPTPTPTSVPPTLTPFPTQVVIINTPPPLIITSPPIYITTPPEVVVVEGKKTVIKSPDQIVEVPGEKIFITQPAVTVIAPPAPPVAGIPENAMYLLLLGASILVFGFLL